MVDASRRGNHTAIANHSCSPSAEPVYYYVQDADAELMHPAIGIFAKFLLIERDWYPGPKTWPLGQLSPTDLPHFASKRIGLGQLGPADSPNFISKMIGPGQLGPADLRNFISKMLPPP